MTTALYRRYRPETFEDVIGQEHVTDPLMTALRKDRVSHAYLFSGPRGCGKTTSARILARCLNCAQGPTATPCGRCDSCRDLARDGAGSLDVIEMDAASHGGVDHARDLRERATFAPVRDRYKIFIIDEAHMVTREGFNALLKIVEEPPEHIKFIFATTEPSKVLTTIRSRTHHYPFRLVPTEPLMHYLERLCAEERVHAAPGVLSLVVRAGGGSVRDTLSVLDQLMGGAGEDGVGYDLAVALLGYTHGALLDDVVDAFASGDAATVFRAVDRVVQTGQDPRRFVEDLLERFRDLIIVDAVPESAGNILHGMPQDQIARLRNQASQLGAAELSRAADITNTALTEMTGATSPQLHLELLCARILLPSSEDTTRGVTARVDRLERRLSIGRGTAHAPTEAPDDARSGAAADSPAPARAEPSSPAAGSDGDGPAPASSGPPRARAVPEEADAAPEASAHTRAPDTLPAPERTQPPARDDVRGDTPREAPVRGEAPAPRAAEPPRQDTPLAEESADGIDMLRASWPEIVNALADIRRVAWFTVQRGTPQSFDGRVLRIMFDAEGDLMNFPRFEDDLRQAVQQILGIDCRAEAVPPGGGHGRGGAPRVPETPPAPSGNRAESTSRSRPEPRSQTRAESRAEARGPAPHTPERERPAPRSGGQQRHHEPPAETPGGRDARQPHGRPAADAHPDRTDPAEPTDPAWDQEPVHSWSVAAIPGGGADAPASSAPAAPPQETEPRPPHRAEPGTDAEQRPAPRPEERHPARPPAPEPTADDTGRPTGSRDRRPPDDDVPPPEEPPDLDEPPYPEDPDEAPPEQWRPAARHESAPPRDSATTPPRGPRNGAGSPGTGPAGAGSPGAPAPSAPVADFPAPAPAAAPEETSEEDAADADRRARPSFRERHAEAIAAGRQAPAPPAAAQAGGVEWDDSFDPSSEDEALEDSTLYGRAAIERILGGMLVEERDLQTGE